MEYLDISKLKRDPDKIRNKLKVVGDSTIATDRLYVYYPVRFIDRGLSSLDRVVRVVSYYCIVDDSGNYGIVNNPVYQHMKPSKIGMVNIGRKSDNKDSYIKLTFEKDDVVLVNNSLVKDGDVIFLIFNEFYLKGNIPWYFNYDDISNCLLGSNKYAGSSVGNEPIVLEIVASVIARDPNNMKLQYKERLKSLDDIGKRPPAYVGLSNIYISYDDTGSKLVGSYFSQGITNAILDPEEKTSDISNLLRA